MISFVNVDNKFCMFVKIIWDRLVIKGVLKFLCENDFYVLCNLLYLSCYFILKKFVC